MIGRLYPFEEVQEALRASGNLVGPIAVGGDQAGK